MKTKSITIIALLCIFMSACKKETATPAETKSTTKPAKQPVINLLCQEWVLSETYYDDKLETSNGTDLYRFEKNGSFWFKEKGMWKNLGSYTFFNQDSSAIIVNFGGGASSEFHWILQKLNEKELNTEFSAGGRKLNYNYTRK